MNVTKKKEIAKFLKEAVEGLQAGNWSCYRYILDENLAIFVGWSCGYGKELRNDCIQDKQDLDWAINAAVKIRNDYDWAEFDCLEYPWSEDDGEIWDSGLSITKDENYLSTAKWLYDNYVGIVKAIQNGEIKIQ